MATCSKCGDNQAVEGQRWCRNCKTLHETARRAGIPDRSFKRGVEQMRTAAIEAFLNLGRQEMNGLTAAQIMRQLKLTE